MDLNYLVINVHVNQKTIFNHVLPAVHHTPTFYKILEYANLGKVWNTRTIIYFPKTLYITPKKHLCSLLFLCIIVCFRVRIRSKLYDPSQTAKPQLMSEQGVLSGSSYLQGGQQLECHELLPEVISALDNGREQVPVGEVAVGRGLPYPPHLLLPGLF